MASNLAKQSNKRAFTPLSTLLIDDGQRARFQQCIDELHEMRNEMADLKNQYKTLVDDTVTNLNVSPKELKLVADLYFNNSLDAKIEEVEALKILLDKLQSNGLIG